jgi:hypothetical protein
MVTLRAVQADEHGRDYAQADSIRILTERPFLAPPCAPISSIGSALHSDS